MPRKAKPPLTNLRIESLSTGVDVNLKDDWTGEVIAQPNAKPPHDSRPLQAKHRQIIRENQLQMLNALGITHEGYKPVQVKPKPKHNQTHTQSGLVMTVKASNPNALKRRF